MLNVEKASISFCEVMLSLVLFPVLAPLAVIVTVVALPFIVVYQVVKAW